eukprot:TRINITY_DN20210_c0_g1_i5.p1 TRINITY_DN20210_c0_g1~~TRINITY_DN20210_c0_g1_i5.p1  ORF type:complete len:114 (-),score=21.36 TRINITY_DN20210_c0_g1_i5:35-376(-)
MYFTRRTMLQCHGVLSAYMESISPARRWAADAHSFIHSSTSFQGPRFRQKYAGTWASSSLSLIHISEPTRLLSISYAVFCLKKKKKEKNKGQRKEKMVQKKKEKKERKKRKKK